MNQTNRLQWADAVIIGGGMVGASVAVALAKQGFEIALCETQPVSNNTAQQWQTEAKDDTGYGTRVSALAPYSVQWLKSLGAWTHLQTTGRAFPIQGMQVWSHQQNDQDQKIHFGHSAITTNESGELGAVIENQLIQWSLWQEIRTLPNIRVVHDQWTRLDREHPDQVRVEFSHAPTLSSSLLIAADGAHSQVRQRLGIDMALRPYHQVAMVGNVRSEQSNAQQCYQAYQPSGPFALLTLGQHLNSIAWYQTETSAKQVLSLSPQEQAKHIEKLSDGCLGAIEVVSPLTYFPLSGGQASRYVDDRVVLVGDAAHRVHPQAGQGVNMGFLDGATLVELLLKLRQQHQDIGNKRHLRPYEFMRKIDNRLVIGAMEGIRWLLDTQHPLPTLATGLEKSVINLATHLPFTGHLMSKISQNGRLPLPKAMRA